MELLIKIEKDTEDVKKALLGDDTVGRSSILFREASSLGIKEKCYYCLISGTEEQCNKAKKLVEDKAKLIEGEEKQKIIQKIRSEEEKAAEGFGAIFKL
jgi:hypothetical protein